MENYERMTEARDSRRPSKTEDQFTKTIEEYTSADLVLRCYQSD